MKIKNRKKNDRKAFYRMSPTEYRKLSKHQRGLKRKD